MDRQRVVDAILDYRANDLDQTSDVPLADSPEARELLKSDPFAFLLGVIFDEGIKAERAWAAPYLLRQRLGHLDPYRMRNEPAQVREAIAQRPTLHRYINLMAEAVVRAAARVCDDYDGDTSQIWRTGSTAEQVDERLRAFHRIGQKKAAMAVEILVNRYRVPLRDLSGTDIAYDIHIRRVLLRTGIVGVDEPQEMIEAARRLYPERPGLLDLPVWSIGRTWCRPETPDCAGCPLDDVCPKLVASAADVR